MKIASVRVPPVGSSRLVVLLVAAIGRRASPSRRFRSRAASRSRRAVSPHRPLPNKPMEFDTGEGQKIRVVVVTTALEYPWSLAFLPDGSMLVTERAGRLRIIRNGVLDPQPIAGAPASYWAGESGLPGAVHGYMDIALHPKFAENRLRLSHLHQAARRETPDGRDRPRDASTATRSPRSATSSWRMPPAPRASRSVVTARSS